MINVSSRSPKFPYHWRIMELCDCFRQKLSHCKVEDDKERTNVCTIKKVERTLYLLFRCKLRNFEYRNVWFDEELPVQCGTQIARGSRSGVFWWRGLVKSASEEGSCNLGFGSLMWVRTSGRWRVQRASRTSGRKWGGRVARMRRISGNKRINTEGVT